MITERRVFSDDYLPTIKHREAETAALTRAFEPITYDDPADDVLLYGPQGVGKTVLSRDAVDRLARETGVDHAHVQCLGKTTAGVLRAILRQLPGSDPARTTPTDRLRSQLRKRVDEPTVVVLDEGDDLPATDALGVLHAIPDLSFVAICHNHTEWLSRASDDTRHAVTGQTIGLAKYSTAELTDILDERRRMGLERGVISNSQLERIADGAAGQARWAIYSLRAAGHLAAERGHEQIRDDDVADCFARARRELREQALDSLPFHHHVLYEIVRRRGRVDGGTIHSRYDSVSGAVYDGREQTPISKREQRTKLQKLADYDLIDFEGEDINREYWPCDASIASPLDLHVPVP
jgi:Cdc6-like AAA superfamily ATPase